MRLKFSSSMFTFCFNDSCIFLLFLISLYFSQPTYPQHRVASPSFIDASPAVPPGVMATAGLFTLAPVPWITRPPTFLYTRSLGESETLKKGWSGVVPLSLILSIAMCGEYVWLCSCACLCVGALAKTVSREHLVRGLSLSIQGRFVAVSVISFLLSLSIRVFARALPRQTAQKIM